MNIIVSRQSDNEYELARYLWGKLMTFDEYYKKLGFDKYPFAVFNAEGEKDITEELFAKPQNYTIIHAGISSTSGIIVGERGTGKTALSLYLGSTLSGEDSLLVRIEDFSDLDTGYQSKDLYRMLTERIASSFFLKVAERPISLWKLTKDERKDLSMFLHEYVGASTKEQLREKVIKVQNSFIKRFGIFFYNVIRLS
jgi:hypothetical protein